MAKGQSRWTMVAMNPTLVFGVSAINSLTDDVLDVVKKTMNGLMYPSAAPMTCGIVDIHDVSKAHVLAGIVKRDLTGRFILNHSCAPNLCLHLAGMWIWMWMWMRVWVWMFCVRGCGCGSACGCACACACGCGCGNLCVCICARIFVCVRVCVCNFF
jgi:hypothetical protein